MTFRTILFTNGQFEKGKKYVIIIILNFGS